MRGLAGGMILVLLGVYFIDNYLHARHPPGVLVPSDPYQGPIGSGVAWKENGNQFTPLADFHLRARILRTESYWLDHGSGISPLDLAVGWGPMSDQAVLDQMYSIRCPSPKDNVGILGALSINACHFQTMKSYRIVPTSTPFRQPRRSRNSSAGSAQETSQNWMGP